MKNYEAFFKEKHDKVYNSLLERYKEAIDKPGPFLDKRSQIIQTIGFEREIILKDKDPKDPFAGSYKTYYNKFKEDIISRFKLINENYPKGGINEFVKYDLPLTRKNHIRRYQSKSSEMYTFDPRFMYDATDEEILELIAAYTAYEAFFEQLRRRESPTDKNLEDSVDVDSDKIYIRKPRTPVRKPNDNFTSLSLVQTAMLFRLLKEHSIILSDSNYQPDTELAKAIHILTGYSNNTIRPELGKPLHHSDRNEGDIKAVYSTLSKIVSELKNKY